MRRSRDQFGRFLPRHYNLEQLQEEQHSKLEEQVKKFEQQQQQNEMGDRVEVEDPPPNSTCSYPINLNIRDNEPPMKNILSSVLPTSRGKTFEDRNHFIFEFKVLCQAYDYI